MDILSLQQKLLEKLKLPYYKTAGAFILLIGLLWIMSISNSSIAPIVTPTSNGPVLTIDPKAFQKVKSDLEASQKEAAKLHEELQDVRKSVESWTSRADEIDQLAEALSTPAGLAHVVANMLHDSPAMLNEHGSPLLTYHKLFEKFGATGEDTALRLLMAAFTGGGAAGFTYRAEALQPVVKIFLPTEVAQSLVGIKSVLSKPVDWKVVGPVYLTWLNDCRYGGIENDACQSNSKKGAELFEEKELSEDQWRAIGMFYRFFLKQGADTDAAKLLAAIQTAGLKAFEAKGL